MHQAVGLASIALRSPCAYLHLCMQATVEAQQEEQLKPHKQRRQHQALRGGTRWAGEEFEAWHVGDSNSLAALQP